MSAHGPINNARLKSFIDRIEKLIEERKAIQDDIKDVFSEAKGVGYDVKTMRWVVQERKVDAADRDERDNLRDTYAHALGMAVEAVRNGMTYREAEEEFGFSKSAIHRASHQPRDNVSGTDREMVEGDLGAYMPEPEMTMPELAAATMALPPKQAAAVVAVLDALRDEPDLDLPPFLDQRKQVMA